MDDDDPWMDEDLSDPVILQRNSTQEWETLSTKFQDVSEHAALQTRRKPVGRTTPLLTFARLPCHRH